MKLDTQGTWHVPPPPKEQVKVTAHPVPPEHLTLAPVGAVPTEPTVIVRLPKDAP